jgi:hypothetical protein
VYGTVGLSQLVSNVSTGEMQPAGLAPGFGADFTYFFARHWGVAAGLEAAFFGSRLFNARFNVGQPGVNSLTKHTCRLYATYLRIPLWLRFRTPLRRHELRASLGGSFDLALAGRYRTETRLRTGGSTEAATTSGSVRFGSGASLGGEAGLRWRLGAHWGLYTGVYAGYGLPSVFAGSDGLPVVDTHLFAAGAKLGVCHN